MEIVYADPRIVVAVKPAGVLSTDEPGGMPQLLRQELGTPCIRTVHRLDAAVSGLMVYARSAKAASLLSEQIRSRTFGKEYLAVVHGVPEGGVMTDLLGRDPVRRRTYVAAEPGESPSVPGSAPSVLRASAAQYATAIGSVQPMAGCSSSFRIATYSR